MNSVTRTLWLACLVAVLPLTGAWAGTLNFTNGVLATLNGIYEDPASLTAARAPVVCHIDCTHPDTLRADRSKIGYLKTLKQNVERLSGLPYVVVHYSQLDGQNVPAPCIKALIVTRIDKTLDDKFKQRVLDILRSTTLPTIGFCGGHQLIVQAHGGKIGLMRKLAPGEKDPRPAYHPGVFKEWAFLPVRVVKPDPIFEGLGSPFTVQEFHAFEVTVLPDCFDVLASTDECRVQAVRHKTKLMYGTQFHPEDFKPDHPDGEVMLRNFFRLAGLGAAKK